MSARARDERKRPSGRFSHWGGDCSSVVLLALLRLPCRLWRDSALLAYAEVFFLGVESGEEHLAAIAESILHFCL